MKQFSNNKDFHEYLLGLVSLLKQRGTEDLAEIAAAAARHSTELSTEFLGESRIALRRIVQMENNILSENERSDLKDVLRQLDKAFERRA